MESSIHLIWATAAMMIFMMVVVGGLYSEIIESDYEKCLDECHFSYNDQLEANCLESCQKVLECSTGEDKRDEHEDLLPPPL